MVFVTGCRSSHFQGGGGWGGARACVRLGVRRDKSYPERLFILVLLLELKQECWSQLKPNTWMATELSPSRASI